jgi:RNA polymerase sigma-70 factor (sigma-E family)
MRRGQAVGFEEFAAARWSALLHFARLLTGGNQHRAEDLVQEALVKLWSVWHKVADQAPEPYVRRVLAREAARSARRRWWGEYPTERLPDLASGPDESAAVDERSRLERALAQLPARQRTAVVLRYYQDLSEREVAEILGCPLGTARSLVSRGVARLRTALTETAEPVGRRRNDG